MVSTRTQTGTIATKHYDLATLTLNASPPISPTISGSHPRRSPKKSRKPSTKPRSPITKIKPPPKPSHSKRPSSPLGFSPRSPTFASQMQLNSLPTSMVDICDGINFFPSRAWGEKEEVGLSPIGRAEKEVAIWEEVKRAHAEGGLEEIVPGIEMTVKAARMKLDYLREEERRGRRDVGRAGEENPAQTAIEDRLKALRWTLEKSNFEPQKENISGAIEAYRSGAIQYSDHFTILYAGKVVDTAPNYGAFVVDRQERLNRYHEVHGPHWIWYEPPLNVDPESRPQMLGSMGLHRAANYTNLGAWHITQGFWKRSGWVMRMAATGPATPSPMEPSFLRNADGSVYCQNVGPKQAFRSVLDSGATYPSLYREDFQKLMIDDQNYAAQSVETLNTANGVVYARLFELFVCVLDEQQKQLVDENHCAHPYHAKYLGGLCPVVEAQGSVTYDAEGREVSSRLSGLLPFVACYVASAPTRNTMWLGEDRKDVLGSHRLPGGRKWDINLPLGPPAGFDDIAQKYGDPKTTFSHRGGKILDEDDPNMDFASTVTLMKGTPQESSIRNCPKEDVEAKREAARKEQENALRNRPEVLKAAMTEQARKQQVKEQQQQQQGQAAPGLGGAGPSNLRRGEPSPFREGSENPTLALAHGEGEMDTGPG